jgi:transcription antitermination factor NusG
MVCLKHNQWFAIQVKSRREKAVALALSVKGYEEFLPLYRRKRRKCNEATETPLFPGYLFCRFDSEVHGSIVTTPGVIRIVGFGSRSFPVADEEINSIRCIINSNMDPVVCPYLRIGEPIRIEKGPLAGASGFIVRVRNRTRIVVSINLLQRSVAVEVDSSVAAPAGRISNHSHEQLPGISGQPWPVRPPVPMPEEIEPYDGRGVRDFSVA